MPQEVPDNREQYLSTRWVSAQEAMKDPGYTIGRIDTRTLNTITDYGIKIEQGRNGNGDGIVIMNKDKKFRAFLWTDDGIPQEVPGWAIALDSGTKELSLSSLKWDGYNNPNAPLRIISKNRDGTTDYIIFEKIKPEERFLDAKAIDTQLANRSIQAKDLVDNSLIQKSIIREWNTVSDVSVQRIKELFIEWAKKINPRSELSQQSPSNISIRSRIPVFGSIPNLPKQGPNGIEYSNTPWFTIVDKNDTSRMYWVVTIDE